MMWSVKLRIDPASKVPPYEQLRAQLERMVLRGSLLPGERVVPVRDLAAELGVAPNTVAKTYRELETAGLLIGRGRRGTFVAERLPERPTGAEAMLRKAAGAYAARARGLGFGSERALLEVRRALRAR
jgi:DNA-binding transcriptional regulator YhcF (GntR family)